MKKTLSIILLVALTVQHFSFASINFAEEPEATMTGEDTSHSLIEESEITQDTTATSESEPPNEQETLETTESTSETVEPTKETNQPVVETPQTEQTKDSFTGGIEEQTDIVVMPQQTVDCTELFVKTIENSLTFHPIEWNQSTEKFIEKVGEYARVIGQDNDLYASVMIAQAILESGSGSSLLAQEPNNNLFGMKGAHKGQSVSFSTNEDNGTGSMYQIKASFRKYPSVKESFEDYSDLLKGGITGNEAIYRSAWKSQTTSYQDATQALTGTYATDIQYSNKLDQLIETYHLTQYDHKKEAVVAGGDYEPYNNINYDLGNSYAFGNCTQYVYNRITQLGGSIDLDMGSGADWGMIGRLRGYEVSHTPKAGTAVSFNPNVLGADSIYGHVSFVEKVNEDGSILISEMNVQGLNLVSTRTIQAEYTGMLTYVTPK